MNALHRENFLPQLQESLNHAIFIATHYRQQLEKEENHIAELFKQAKTHKISINQLFTEEGII